MLRYVLPAFSNDVMFSDNGPRGGTSIPLQRVTSLRRRAQANAPAASYRLSFVLENDGRRDWTIPSCKGMPGAELATQRCLVET